VNKDQYLEVIDQKKNLLFRYITLFLNFIGIILLPLYALAKIRGKIYGSSFFRCFESPTLLISLSFKWMGRGILQFYQNCYQFEPLKMQ
jgi:hypothetical protein